MLCRVGKCPISKPCSSATHPKVKHSACGSLNICRRSFRLMAIITRPQCSHARPHLVRSRWQWRISVTVADLPVRPGGTERITTIIVTRHVSENDDDQTRERLGEEVLQRQGGVMSTPMDALKPIFSQTETRRRW